MSAIQIHDRTQFIDKRTCFPPRIGLSSDHSVTQIDSTYHACIIVVRLGGRILSWDVPGHIRHCSMLNALICTTTSSLTPFSKGLVALFAALNAEICAECNVRPPPAIDIPQANAAHAVLFTSARMLRNLIT